MSARHFACFALASALALGAQARAQFPTLPAPLPLDSDAAMDLRTDTAPTLARGLGGVLVCVAQTDDQGTDQDLKWRRSADGGLTWSAPALLNTATGATDFVTVHDVVPSLATDGAGTWLCVWASNGNSLGNQGDYDLQQARSTDNGSTWTHSTTPINTLHATDGTTFDSSPRLVHGGAGTWICAWSIGSEIDLWCMRSTDAGTTWSPQQRLNTLGATDSVSDFECSLAGAASGAWVAVWRSTESLGGTIGNDADVLCTRSVDDGLSWSAPAPVNAYASTDSDQDGAPTIATNGSGRWLCVWNSTYLPAGMGSHAGLLCAESADAGLTWSAVRTVLSLAGGAGRARLYSDGGINWVVGWERQDFTNWNLWVARSVDAGVSWTAQTYLNTNAPSDDGNDQAVVFADDGAGHFLAVWHSTSTLGGTIQSDHDLLRVRFDLPTSLASPFCSGDGSATPCPCGNAGLAGRGCASSENPSGATLGASGTPSLAGDTLVLLGSGMTNAPCLYFQGTAQQNLGAGAVFGDGLRCAGGTAIRLDIALNVGGASQFPAMGDPPISLPGMIGAPGTRTYQVWYRDAQSFCTAFTFNLTNGLVVSWVP